MLCAKFPSLGRQGRHNSPSINSFKYGRHARSSGITAEGSPHDGTRSRTPAERSPKPSNPVARFSDAIGRWSLIAMTEIGET
jgi:hypothetical protein